MRRLHQSLPQKQTLINKTTTGAPPPVFFIITPTHRGASRIARLYHISPLVGAGAFDGPFPRPFTRSLPSFRANAMNLATFNHSTFINLYPSYNLILHSVQNDTLHHTHRRGDSRITRRCIHPFLIGTGVATARFFLHPHHDPTVGAIHESPAFYPQQTKKTPHKGVFFFPLPLLFQFQSPRIRRLNRNRRHFLQVAFVQSRHPRQGRATRRTNAIF